MWTTRPVRFEITETVSEKRVEAHTVGRPRAGGYGLMFWFRWNRLSGSYFRFTSTSLS
jgi:hypothetical protein